MNAEVVVAEMWGGRLWDGPIVVEVVDPASPPTEAELDAIAVALTAENCGVRPVVRTVERFGPLVARVEW